MFLNEEFNEEFIEENHKFRITIVKMFFDA